MFEHTSSRRTWIVIAAGVVFALSSTASAAVWTGLGTTNNASEAANWSGGVLPTSSSVITLDATSTKNMLWDGGVGGLPTTVAGWSQASTYTGTVTVNTTYSAFSTTFTTLTITGNADIQGGTWTHTVNGKGTNSTAPVDQYRLRVNIGGDLTLGSAAKIDVTNQGYLAGAPTGNGGAGHGGRGNGTATVYNSTYDSIFEPTLHGRGSGSSSGDGRDGGGAVYLVVSGTSTIHGDILADNVVGTSTAFRRGGAGGSIFISTGDIAGTGTLRAKGGDSGTGSNSGNGGGGRVGIVLTGGSADFSSFSGTILANSGYNPSQANQVAQQASAGSIYLRRGDQAVGRGTLLLDFNNQYGDLDTDYGFQFTTEDLSLVDVVMQRQAKLDVNASKTIGSLAGAKNVNIQLLSGQTLTTGNNNASTTYSGSLFSSGHLTKIGSGTLTLDGHSYTHTGNVNVNDGVLLVNGGAVAAASKSGTTTANVLTVTGIDTTGLVVGQPISGTGIRAGTFISSIDSATQITLSQTASATGTNTFTFSAGAGLTGAVNVNAGGTLGGSGFISGLVTVADNATLAPGNSAGTLTINNNLLLSGLSNLDWELGTPWQYDGSNYPSPNDLVRVNGNLALDGQLAVTGLTGFGVGTYTLLTYTGTLTDNTLAVAYLPSGYSGSIQIDTINQAVNLVVVPEPGTLVLFAAGVVLIASRRKASPGRELTPC
jgi:fibronectin-binding autotransporter adhesin